MAELSPDDVDAYTGGRLSTDDPATQRMLTAALVAARRSVGWHVSPVNLGDVFLLDGPGGRKLRLPTMNIIDLISVVETNSAGVSTTLDLTPYTGDVMVSRSVPWLLHRSRGAWARNYGAIAVTLDHGFPEEDAADWREAILSMVSQMATLAAVGRPDTELVQKQVDDVVYRWGDLAGQVLPSVETMLDKFRLLWGWA